MRTLSQDLVEQIERQSVAPPTTVTSGVHRIGPANDVEPLSTPAPATSRTGSAVSWLLSWLLPIGCPIIAWSAGEASAWALWLLSLSPLVGVWLRGRWGAAAIGAFSLMTMVTLPLVREGIHLGDIAPQIAANVVAAALALLLGLRFGRSR